jgi:alpha-tubulin suppressor-like RCC1 family protein
VGALAVLAVCGSLATGVAVAANTPPKISKQPLNVTVDDGQPASFTATATGTPTPTEQWEVSTDGGTSFTPIEGATSSTYTIAATSYLESGYQFRARFQNVAGEVLSKAAILTVHKAPLVTLQPQSVTVEEGQNATFEAQAIGSPAPTVQWQTSANGGTNWTNISGATATQLTLTAVKTSLNGHLYRAVFKNTIATTDSEAATLTVQVKPAVTKQPQNATVNVGNNATFEATASGFPVPAVQWQVSPDGGFTWEAIEGATSTVLTVANVSHSQDGYQYRAVFTNGAGSVTTNAAMLTVLSPPAILQQPSSVIVMVGEPATFEAEATGFPAPTVQWELSTNGGATWSAISEATSTQYTIASPELSQSGNEYRATFTNSAGTATTSAATLTVASNNYKALAWGQNLSHQLGNESALADFPVPVEPKGLHFVAQVAAGGRHSLALLADGTVSAWGNDEYDQIGDGGGVAQEVPVAVAGLSNVKAIAAGANHSLALLKDGTVRAWGNDESGQLGNGTTKESEGLVTVKGLTGVKAIAAGGSHSLALLANGTVMAWGNDETGQLGNGSVKTSDVPVAVKSLSGVTAIAAGGDFSLALLSSGSIDAWGSDFYGQLANSAAAEETFSTTALPVVGVSGATAIAAGTEHALALLGNGTVMAWGEDAAGELGNGTIKTSQETPVAVSGLAGVAGISAGGKISVALLSSGSLKSWGYNHWGALGDGMVGEPSTTPVAVSAIGRAASVSAGGSHMLAFGEPIPTVTGVSPGIGAAGGGTKVTISGSDLTGASEVHFGTTAATEVTAVSATEVTATAPPGSGTVHVTVTTPNGTSTANPSDRFIYQNLPTVTKLSPTSGPVAGGTAVTITGTEFTAASSVKFGGVEAAGYKVNSATSITAVAPAESAAIVDVTVTNTAGTSTITPKDHFKYTPTIESVSPNAGPVAGGTSVTVTGTGFSTVAKATAFKFGKSTPKSVSCSSSTTCTMITSAAAAAGTVNVVATVNKAASPVSPAATFTYS